MDRELKLTLAVPAELAPEGTTIRMAGTPDAPLCCLADVCAVLGNANPRQVAERIDEDEKTTVHIVDGAGGPPRTFVTEAGLYAVILTSRAENARPFRRW